MPRVLGVDPGTISIDICGLDDGRLFLDESVPTADALRDAHGFVARLAAAAPLDLIAGPSGYGLPCVRGGELTNDDVRLAFLAAEGESGGIGGLRALVHALSRSALPVVFTPGVIHLDSVPAHRKVNRVDMGTADKVCAVAVALRAHADRRRCRFTDAAFVLLELGGAFSAALAVTGGRIVDGVGGSSGPMGLRAAGALDGEVAFLAGRVPKSMIFSGGAASIAGDEDSAALIRPASARHELARDAYIESAIKSVVAMAASAPDAREVILSGRMARVPAVRELIAQRLGQAGVRMAVDVLAGSVSVGTHAAEGAAMIADGLTGGPHAELVAALGISAARGTVLDHLYVVTRERAKKTLGID